MSLPIIKPGTSREIVSDGIYTWTGGGGPGFGWDGNGPTSDAGEPKNPPPTQTVSYNTTWYVHNSAYVCQGASGPDGVIVPPYNDWDVEYIDSTEGGGVICLVSVPPGTPFGTYVAHRNTNTSGAGSNTYAYHYMLFEVGIIPAPAPPTIAATGLLIENVPTIRLDIA